MAGMEPDELEETELKGRGKVRAGHAGDSLVLRIDALTTQTRRFKPLVREFFRKEFRAARPVFGDYQVEILIIQPDETRGKHDVDNVAKAILDALTGAAFRDDVQVTKLTVEKISGDRPRLWVRASPRA